MSDFKVGIIGLGHVGAHVLYTLALQGLADDFLLVDLEEKKGKLTSERQDVLDSTEFLPHKVSVRIGEIEDLGDRDVIINAVGDIAALKGTDTATIKSATEALTQAFYKLSEKLYQANGANPGAAGPDVSGGAAGSGNPGGQGYQDADYEVVDDDDQK